MKEAKKFLKAKGLKDTLYNVNYNPNQNRGLPQKEWIKNGLSALLDEYADCKVKIFSSNLVLGAVKKAKADFKLVGLSKPYSMTCRTDKTEIAFWPKVGIPRERFDALWKYCKDNWNDKKIAEIEHEGLRDDGTPINGIVVGVREL